MLVFRPEEVVGKYDLYEVVLRSESATEDWDKFKKACEEVKKKLNENH